MHGVLAQIIENNLAPARANTQSEHRRIVLQILHECWPQSNLNIDASDLVTPQTNASLTGEDPFYDVLEDDAPGILVRTDYSNEDAWHAFCTKLRDSERDVLELPSQPPETGTEDDPEPDTNHTEDVSMDEGDESDDSSDTPITSVIRVLSASRPEERAMLNNISNIAALRLFNDIDLRPAPLPLPGTKRIDTPNSLIDKNGWQEIYQGKTIWIYDSCSPQDGCARLVSQSGDFYGTATGDSWRARVSHIPELQLNMSLLGMKIDFGGLDKWDFNERKRNLREARMQ